MLFVRSCGCGWMTFWMNGAASRTRSPKVGSGLKYQEYEDGGDPHLLFDPLDPELAKQPAGARKFRAQRSLRDVEPSVNLWVRRLDGVEVPEEEAE